MDRRAYLTALGATAAAVSGCSGGDSTGTANTTGTVATATDGEPTPTKWGTETEQSSTDQPEATPTPRVTDSGLLVDSGSFTTLDDIDSVGQGGSLVVGAEYELPVSDGNARGLVEARVLDSDGTELSTASEAVDAVVTDDTEFYSDSSSFAFDTASQEQGSYTVEMLVNSVAYGTSTSTEVAAEIVAPLGAGEVEMYIAEFPGEVAARETFDWTLGFRNLTDRDSSVVTDFLTIDSARNDPVTFESHHRENVPASDAIQVRREDNRFSHPGTYTYRIDEIDAEVSFTIQSPE